MRDKRRDQWPSGRNRAVRRSLPVEPPTQLRFRVISIRHVTSCLCTSRHYAFLMTVCIHHIHRQFGSGFGDVPLAPLASHLAAMPWGLRHSKPIWFGAAWRDARRCGRSRVGWVGGSEIGLEHPAQVGDLRGFVGMLGSPRGARRRWDLLKSASAELPNAVCAPTDT